MRSFVASLFLLLSGADSQATMGLELQEASNELMGKAQKIEGQRRRLDQTQQYSNFQYTSGSIVSSAHSIQFDSCVSVPIEPASTETLFSNNNIEYAKQGAIYAEKSYVKFRVCETKKECYYDSDEGDLYMLDLTTFLTAVIKFYPKKQYYYCKACQKSQDACNFQKYYQWQQSKSQSQAAAAANETNNNGGRDLASSSSSKNNNSPRQDPVDCYECEKMGCFGSAQEQEQAPESDDKNENYQQYYQQYYYNQQQGNQQQDPTESMQNAANLAYNFLGCEKTGTKFNDDRIYASLKCTDDGMGVEVAAFLDDECTIYVNVTMDELFQGNDYESEVEQVISYPFKNDLDCGDMFNYAPAYYNPSDDKYQTYYGQPNKYCSNLFQGKTLDLDDCSGTKSQTTSESVTYENEEYYSWYQYVLSQSDLQSPLTVCNIMKNYGSGETYRASSVNKFLNQAKNYVNEQWAKADKMTAAGILGVIILAMLAMAGCAWACCIPEQEDPEAKETFEEKRERFVVEDDGTGRIKIV